MNRRAFIAGLGGTAAWPIAARAQQQAMLIVGILDFVPPLARSQQLMAAFRRGLTETGYVEGRNFAFEYRWFDLQYDRLPELAADLLRHKAAVIFAIGPHPVLALKAQTATIPIVFYVGEDPVKEGLVSSLNRPGGNVTGVTNFENQLFGKQMGLLFEVVPKGTVFAFLVNPDNLNAEADAKEAQAAAKALGLELRVLNARSESELELAFAAMVAQRIDGLLVGVGAGDLKLLIELAAHHVIPAMYYDRRYPAAGGLMSYGASEADAWHLCGVYVGRILKGEKPTDLPVQQSTKFEFVINLQTAKLLGINVPPDVLAIADEVIE
jgi:putative tryptophan/tyrosine transport system substrate-binding protein